MLLHYWIPQKILNIFVNYLHIINIIISERLNYTHEDYINLFIIIYGECT